MKLRTRLIIAFTYVLLAVVVALTIPLAVSLSRRAKTDLESRTLRDAQTIAAYITAGMLSEPTELERLLAETTPATIERVVVVDDRGIVIHDSAGTSLGEDFTNGERPEIDAALAGQAVAGDRFSDTAGEPILVAAAPIIDGQPIGALRLTSDYAEVDAAARRTVIGLIVIGGAAILTGVIIAFALAGSIARPIQRLAAAAHRLGGGDLSARAGPVGGAAEVGDLAASFDAMAERLERAVRAQREFVANASHQLRTPLTGMKLRLEGASDSTDDPELRRQLEAAEHEVDRLAEIVERLLVVARRIEQGEPAALDLRVAARRAAERWSERATRMESAIETAGGSADAAADPADIDQILDNLLDNAIAYAPGPIKIATSADGADAVLVVADRGPGIPDDERSAVTERFYRGKGAPSGGSGLGLAIAHELTERWGGSLSIRSPAMGGSEIEIRLPRADDHASPTNGDPTDE